MGTRVKNLEREKVEIIIDWCIKKFGYSKYFKKHPKLRVYKSGGTSESYKYSNLGTYYLGTITIYLGAHKSVKQLCSTVLHEYKHYLLSLDEYFKIQSRLEKKGLKQLQINQEHPHEIKCREFEKKWVDLCFKELRNKLYKK